MNLLPNKVSNKSFVAITYDAKYGVAVLVGYSNLPEGIKWGLFHVLKI